MLCVVQLSAYNVGNIYDIAEWAKLNGVSYFCINQTADRIQLPDGMTSLIISGAPLPSKCSDHLSGLIASLDVPVFGICFGCMAIVRAYGGTLVDDCREPSVITVDGTRFPWFSGPSKATAAHRERIETLGALESCLWDVATNEVVGIRHPTKPVFGTMFHPESPLTQCGSNMLHAFLRL